MKRISYMFIAVLALSLAPIAGHACPGGDKGVTASDSSTAATVAKMRETAAKIADKFQTNVIPAILLVLEHIIPMDPVTGVLAPTLLDPENAKAVYTGVPAIVNRASVIERASRDDL
jgi:hypothetical protein